MEEVRLEKNDELVMKLLHFFITEQGYSPIVLHGAKNEIWLENLDENYQIVRIVSNYIHNDEQLNFDLFRTQKIVNKIKKKTMSFNITTLSLFVNLGDNVDIEPYMHSNHLDCAEVNNVKDLKKYEFIMNEFPTITKDTNFKEKGMELFMKITKEIGEKNESDSIKAEEVFKKKTPYLTYFIITINVLVFFATYLFGKGSQDSLTLLRFGANYAPLVKNGEYYRLITSAFLHAGIFHLLFNCYALYIVGMQIESFLGKTKFLIVYLFSALTGSLMSVIFNDSICVGASGAIFGLFGALLYFGYHYRIYLGTVIKSQIIPLILFNLALGFVLNGIANSAHIKGLVGGLLITMALGVKYKSSKSEKINGLIISLIYLCFLIYVAFFFH